MILFVDQSGAMGGAQTVMLALLAAARQVRPVALLCPEGPLHDEVKTRFNGNVPTNICARPQTATGQKSWLDIVRLAGYTFSFLRHLRLLQRADLIYCNGSRQLPTLLLLSLVLNRKVIYHIHTDYGRLEKIAIRIAASARTTAAIISNSQFTAQRLGVSSVVVENALDDRFAALPFRDRFTGKSGQLRAAVIGKIIPEKGQDIAANAVSGLPMQLHLIGDAAEAPLAYRDQISSAALDGVTSDVPDVLERKGIQINIVPSVVQEAFGLVAIEGMAASCITIVSGRGGLTQIAERTGAWIAPDVDTLHKQLSRLIAMPPPERVQLAISQYEATQRVYAPARFQSQMIGILQGALTKRAYREHVPDC